jgi:hypothetical protein
MMMPGDLPSRPLIAIASDLREERTIAVPRCRSTGSEPIPC